MSKLNNRNTIVIILAYFHRYGLLLLILLLALCFAGTKGGPLLGMGIGMIIDSVYSFVGYVLRWKHIYCSYQNACRLKMTPNHINWSIIKKFDAYGTPIISGVLGIASVLVSVFLAQ